MTTAQERLDKVRHQIDEVMEKGQRVRSGDRQVDRAELASLRMLEEQYAKQAARDSVRQAGRPRVTRLYHGGKGI